MGLMHFDRRCLVVLKSKGRVLLPVDIFSLKPSKELWVSEMLGLPVESEEVRQATAMLRSAIGHC